MIINTLNNTKMKEENKTTAPVVLSDAELNEVVGGRQIVNCSSLKTKAECIANNNPCNWAGMSNTVGQCIARPTTSAL